MIGDHPGNNPLYLSIECVLMVYLAHAKIETLKFVSLEGAELVVKATVHSSIMSLPSSQSVTMSVPESGEGGEDEYSELQ